jgi:hypothetical protein
MKVRNRYGGGTMIELADVVSDLRAELERARDAAVGKELRFEIGSIELEVAVALEKAGGGGAKVRFWVVELGGDAKMSNTSTQRIKLTLLPTLADGESKPYIAGSASPTER